MNRIKQLREKFGWKQSELGILIGVQAATVSKYEKEDVQLTSETIKKLANIFQVSIEYLLCVTDDPSPAINTKDNAIFSITDPEDVLMFHTFKALSDGQKAIIRDLIIKEKSLEEELNVNKH